MTFRAIRTGLAALTLTLPLGAAHAGDEKNEVQATIAAGDTLTVLEPGAVGVDVWFPNRNGTSDRAASLFREAGVQAFGFDGGPAVDMYDWRANRLRPWPDEARHNENFGTTHGRLGKFEDVLQPRVTFDDFGRFLKKLGAAGRVHVNYGTGTPGEAAAWVAYSRAKGYPVRYWEIGQFQSGNGTLGNGDQPDAHADKSARGYAANALKFIAAMRAADPGIRIGVHLHSATKPDSPGRGWNEEVLSILAPQIDFIDVWAFPKRGTDAEVLQTPATLGEWIASYKEQLARLGAPGRSYEIVIGETTIDVAGAPHNKSLAAALFLPDQVLTLLSHGVRRVDWFATHLGPVPKFWYSWAWLKPEARTPANMLHPPEAQYGEYGLLASGDCDPGTNLCDLPANTPFAPYYGLKMLRPLGGAGTRLVRTASSDPLVAVHAGVRPDGSVAVLMINKDPLAPRTVSLRLDAFDPSPNAVVLRYGRGNRDLECEAAAPGGAPSIETPPYSLTMLVIPSRGGRAVSCASVTN
jgi:hypothetical protein